MASRFIKWTVFKMCHFWVVPLQRNYFALKRLIATTVSVACLVVCCSQGKHPLKGDTAFQRQLNAFYKDVTTSPLKQEDLDYFEGLDFFKFDSAYVVTAVLKRRLVPSFSMVKTTGKRQPSAMRVYGVATFRLKGMLYQLTLYRNEDALKESRRSDRLFLPFSDETNGTETYSGGRYINVRLPKGDTIVIDFNQAYNPYCAYNKMYRCPVVPRINHLKTRIEAGVKAFKSPPERHI